MNNKTSKIEIKEKICDEILLDPSYPAFNADELFNLENPVLNRDGQLLPFHRLRIYLNSQEKEIHTADHLLHEKSFASRKYYSLGLLDNYKRITREKQAHLAAFVIMEPPVVAPHLYASLPELTEHFDYVYVHNVDGDGYSLQGVSREKLRRLFWPIPYNKVLEPYWSKEERKKRIVVINGSHKPQSRVKEQYSIRIQAMVELAELGVVDLFGRDWDKWWSREALWLPYWRNRSTLMSIYQGPCSSKFEILQQYTFCLCFENMAMNGYITEKIFDCLYAGTIPLYLGAPDILEYIPEEVFIDCRKFTSWIEMWKELSAMSDGEIYSMKEAGRKFLQSEKAERFYNSIENIISA